MVEPWEPSFYIIIYRFLAKAIYYWRLLKVKRKQEEKEDEDEKELEEWKEGIEVENEE